MKKLLENALRIFVLNRYFEHDSQGKVITEQSNKFVIDKNMENSLFDSLILCVQIC